MLFAILNIILVRSILDHFTLSLTWIYKVVDPARRVLLLDDEHHVREMSVDLVCLPQSRSPRESPQST
jgi:hypothetical protein